LDPHPTRTIDIKTLLATQLSGMQDALEGFPANALLDQLLDAPQQGDPDRGHAQQLTEHLLEQWIGTLTRDLERFPSPTTDALQRIRQRMVDSRLALRRLQALLRTLGPPQPGQADRASPSPLQ
jgi:hypothetical protein